MTATVLEPGAPADVIAVDGDPLQRVEALGRVRLVVRAGRVVTAGS
jgi:imidazolonepropionase-like amidohydrolase